MIHFGMLKGDLVYIRSFKLMQKDLKGEKQNVTNNTRSTVLVYLDLILIHEYIYCHIYSFGTSAFRCTWPLMTSHS